MFFTLEQRLRASLNEQLKREYGWTPAVLAGSQPPRPELGDFAFAFCFELAKHLRRPPRKVAEEIASKLTLPRGIAKVEVAGPGYLNFFADRADVLRSLEHPSREAVELFPTFGGKVVVEHTNINPNKAAHVGHLRNAALGDTFVRLLRFRREQVEVQNYIDNTGVQVADVVVAFEYLEQKSASQVDDEIRRRAELRQSLEGRLLSGRPHHMLLDRARAQIASGAPLSMGTVTVTSAEQARAAVSFDYLCWDIYADISKHFEQNPDELRWREETLKRIEGGHQPTAHVAESISSAIVRTHLLTMERLNVAYDVLPRESEILHLHFWQTAFELLKQRSAIRLETTGKNAGCWVMDRPANPDPAEPADATASNANKAVEESKVIVRSNGTVTYVGKDIAYQLWKFGLLGLDFKYRRFYQYPDSDWVWVSSDTGESDAPQFGHAVAVFNVIDVRQSYLQEIVVSGLRALGFDQQANRSTHFSYEMVTLTPRCAEDLGYRLTPEERARPHVEVSGRKGFGIKADDLIDKLIERALQEVQTRHPELSESEQLDIAARIGVGALRYFLLKFTKNSLIAFDLQDALSFEGETGPYVQYAVVRARNILRKEQERAGNASAFADELHKQRGFEPGDEQYLADPELWNMVQTAARLEHVVQQAIVTTEPAYLAKYAFQLAQSFNNFYHRHPVLQEIDANKRRFLLALVDRVQARTEAALALMGVEAPEIM